MLQQANPSPSSPESKPGDRYRFIGFEVFPSKSEKFWQSDAEAQKFATQVHAGDADALLHREFSLLETQAMGASDRWILTITSVMMLLTVIMPWVAYRTAAGGDFSLAWPSSLSALLGGIGTAFSSGISVGVAALLSLAVMLGTPIVGAWVLVMNWTKGKSPEVYQLRLRLPLKVAYIIFFSGLAVFALSFIGGDIPGYTTWGLIEPPERYGIAALLKILSVGPYIALGMAMICGVKSGDL